MRNIFLYLCLFNVLPTMAQSADTLGHNFWSGLNFSVTLFEAGRTVPIQSSPNFNISNGMEHYFGHSKGAFCWNYGSIGLYHNNKFGVEVVLFNYQYVGGDNADLKNYFVSTYPELDTRAIFTSAHDYLITGLGYRLGYKHHFNKFTLAPKFQLGFNNYKSYGEQFLFPDLNSNQFVEYRIFQESVNPTIVDYHFLVDFSTIIDLGVQLEIGLKAEYIMIPTNYNYTVTELNYGQAKNTSYFNYKNVYSTFLFGITSKIVLKKGDNARTPLWERKKE